MRTPGRRGLAVGLSQGQVHIRTTWGVQMDAPIIICGKTYNSFSKLANCKIQYFLAIYPDKSTFIVTWKTKFKCRFLRLLKNFHLRKGNMKRAGP